jgi:DNA-binding response OmpR family regulator
MNARPDFNTMSRAELEAYAGDLEGQVDALKSVSVVSGKLALVSAFGVTKMQAAVLAILADGRLHERDQIMDALYWNRDVDDVPLPKIVDVVVHKLRRRVEPHGLTIKTIWGVGYQLENAGRVADLLGEAA